MNLIEALALLCGIADEGADMYEQEYDEGKVDEALVIVDNFVKKLEEEN